METYEAIISKRDTRAYLADPVASDSLDTVLRAARMAGSAKNSQVTRIVVVTDADLRRQLTECGDFTSWIDVAPVILVFAIPVDGGRLFDVGRMAQNAMLAANDLGLATCPVTFHHQDRLREVIGLPETHEGPMAVTLGYPDVTGSARPTAPRMPMSALVHWERWRTSA